MIRNLSILALAAIGIVGCGVPAPDGAAQNASRLLAAAMKNDRVAFEAEIDRTAVRDDVRRQVAEMGRAQALDVEGGPSEFVLDRMIGPDAFRLVHTGSGAALTKPPTAGQVGRLMKTVDAKHACLRDAETPDHCLLTFGKDKGGWRLVGMQARPLKIEVSGD